MITTAAESNPTYFAPTPLTDVERTLTPAYIHLVRSSSLPASRPLAISLSRRFTSRTLFLIPPAPDLLARAQAARSVSTSMTTGRPLSDASRCSRPHIPTYPRRSTWPRVTRFSTRWRPPTCSTSLGARRAWRRDRARARRARGVPHPRRARNGVRGRRRRRAAHGA
jgi:hypothetical protein